MLLLVDRLGSGRQMEASCLTPASERDKFIFFHVDRKMHLIAIVLNHKEKGLEI